MTSTQIKAIREKLDLNQADFARFIGCDARAVHSWERGNTHPNGTTELVLAGLIEMPEERFPAVREDIKRSLHFGGLSYLILNYTPNSDPPPVIRKLRK